MVLEGTTIVDPTKCKGTMAKIKDPGFRIGRAGTRMGMDPTSTALNPTQINHNVPLLINNRTLVNRGTCLIQIKSINLVSLMVHRKEEK